LEKFKVQSSRFKVKRKSWHELFIIYGWGKAHGKLLGKVLSGTGILPVRHISWKPVPPKAAGTEARPTDFLRRFGEAAGS
jgi:hypothetical protein